jgi:hypothetical protein
MTIAGDIEANLDLTFDAVSARNRRILGNDGVSRHAVRIGIDLFDPVLCDGDRDGG